MYEIDFTADFRRMLARCRKGDATRIADAIETHLADNPTGPSRRIKMIVGLDPSWRGEEPFWQFRVGGFRVFYDVDEDTSTVTLRAVGFKGRKTTEELIDEIRQS